MRFILAVLLLVGVAHCNPFRDQFTLEDSDDDHHERRFSPFGFGQNPAGQGFGFGSDSDEDNDSRRPQSDFAQQFNALLQALANAINKSSSDVNKLPPNFHNSTSTKEVVNGTIVTVNETVDKQTDENNNTFFVDTKVIDVQPSIQPEETTAQATVTTFPFETTMAAVEVTSGPSESSSSSKTPEEPSSSVRGIEIGQSTESPMVATSTPSTVSTTFPNQMFNELGGPSQGPTFL